MEIVRKEKQLKEVDVIVERYQLCDKCNEKIEIRTSDAFDFEFMYRTGDFFYEGGAIGEMQKMDLCPKCAAELVSLLRENGYRVNDSYWDS